MHTAVRRTGAGLRRNVSVRPLLVYALAGLAPGTDAAEVIWQARRSLPSGLALGNPVVPGPVSILRKAP